MTNLGHYHTDSHLTVIMTNPGHYHTDYRLAVTVAVIMTNPGRYHTDYRLTVIEFLTKTIHESLPEVLNGCGLRTTLWLNEHDFRAVFRNVHLKHCHLYLYLSSSVYEKHSLEVNQTHP